VSERLSSTVTFLFTDIEGSTQLLKGLGRERYGELLSDHQQLLRNAFAAHNGAEVDTQGDSFFVAFRSAGDALRAAVAIQRVLADHVWPDGVQVRVRIGIHSGEAAGAADRYVGISVHRAARVGAIAHGGQVLVSDSTRVLVEDDPPPGVSLRDLGLYRLKDIDRAERISQMEAEGVRAEFPPLRGAERVKAPVLRRRSVLAAALVGVLAAAVAIPVFALSSGGSKGSSFASPGRSSVASVDPSSGQPTGSVALEASPAAIAYGQGSVWATMPDQDSVSRIDPATSTVQQTIAVGNGPEGIAVGEGFVWVANAIAGTVSQIDPQKNGGQVVDTIAVGNRPRGVAYGLGGVWVANSLDRTVVRIDPLTGAKGRPIPVESGADAIAVGDGALWVTSESAGVLSRVDPRSRSVTPINVGNVPSAVAAGPGAVWVANSGDATVSRIDPATNAVKETIPVDEGPSGVVVAPGGSVWVSAALAGTLSKIDPAAGRVVKNVSVGEQPQGVAVSADATYVAVQGSGAAHRGGTLTLVVPNQSGFYDTGLPKSLDPASGYAAWDLLTVTNDGLVGYGRSGGAESYRVVPDLAATLPTVTDGGKTYTFQLRPGIHYSTGAMVRPADLRRGIERALASSGKNTPSSDLSGIVGARGCVARPTSCNLSKGIATDPSSNSVTFHLVAPDPDFLYKLALPIADAVPADTPLKAHLPLPATGPYEVSKIDAKRSVVRLVRNPHFQVWSAARPDGFPDKIVERWGSSGASAVRAVEGGAADITSTGFDKTWPPTLLSSLQKRYSSRLYAIPELGTLGLWMNTKLAPFDDVRVRQAVNYAVDRNRLVEINGGPDNAQLSCQILSPNTDGYRPYCPYTLTPDGAGTYNGPDLAKARRLVEASGTRGQPITVWFYDIPIGRRNGGYVVSVLRGLGYRARLKTVPHNAANGSTWRPNRQVGISGWGPDYPSASAVFSTSFTCQSYSPIPPNANLNAAAFCARGIDAMIARARRLQITDPAAASRLWTKIDREITDRAPWVAMNVSLNPEFVSRRTGNYTYCFLSAAAGSTSACLDRLWVR
jgi:YVTN family beta-propeller protein